eukprot:650567-Prorocentrum_lima.AAC.1
MTSSLVGSEMCIRDSFDVRIEGYPTEVTWKLRNKYALYIALRSFPALSCLLYTSDAADDM